MPFRALRCLFRVRAGLLCGLKITTYQITVATSNQVVGGRSEAEHEGPQAPKQSVRARNLFVYRKMMIRLMG